MPEGVRLFYGGRVPEHLPGGHQPPPTPVDTASAQWRFMEGLTPEPHMDLDKFMADLAESHRRLEARRQLLLADRKGALAGSGASASAAAASVSPPGLMEV